MKKRITIFLFFLSLTNLVTATGETEIFLKKVPVVMYNSDITPRVFEIQVKSTKTIASISASTYDYCGSEFINFEFKDDGIGNDMVADDGLYASNTEFCHLIITNKEYDFRSMALQTEVSYSDNSSETFIIQTGGYSVNENLFQVDTSIIINTFNDSTFYSKNIVNSIEKRLCQNYDIDYDKSKIISDFKNRWKLFEDSRLVITSFYDTNLNNVAGQYTNDGILTIFTSFVYGLFNHELNHIWVTPGTDVGSENGAHWGYIERETSGFGLGCYNGVFTKLTEVNDEIIWETGPQTDEFNDIELYFMGLISIDEVAFPIKYVSGAQGCERIGNFDGKFGAGTIDEITQSEFQNIISDETFESIKDSLSLKFIIPSNVKLTKFEHSFLEYYISNYDAFFKANTRNLGTIKSELYQIYSDLDNDGFASNVDCNDENPDVNPDQTELPYNGLDDDCNSATLDDDLDQDGYLLSDDCNDDNPNINPDQTEVPYNELDDDCNSATLDDDLDQDGFLLAYDCNDDNPNINPDQTEVPYNELDDDCNSATLDDDLDQDGFLLVDDCDDNNAAINPSALDIPNNGIDEDCDGMDLLSSTHEIANTTIQIYPNPANEIINIDVDGQLNFKINLFDLKGQLVQTFTNKNQIEISSIPSGTYVLEILDLNSTDKIAERIVIGR